MFLKAIPRPKISRSQNEEWQLGGHWNKPTKATQVGREGMLEHSMQKEIDELVWLKQKPLRDRIEKIDLPLAELTRQLADSLQAGPSASENTLMTLTTDMVRVHMTDENVQVNQGQDPRRWPGACAVVALVDASTTR
jgi:hypothetical protein